MTDLLRQEIATSAHTVVVKVGTRVLTTSEGHLDEQRIALLAEELIAQLDAGRRMVLVSSGAVGAGMAQLGLKTRPHDVAHLQAVAAVGQARLIQTYDQTLRKHGRHAAQVLLTADGLNDRTAYLNVRNTILTLLELGALPIINENDTVAVEELMTTFGDNDRLAAMVTNLIQAPLLVIMSDVAGLYNGDPSLPESQVIPTVPRLDETVLSYVRDKKSGVSKGGMASKLEAARIATTAGENVVIAHGHAPGMLTRILAGEEVGTLFLAQGKTISPYKRWIGFSKQPRGKLRLDEGARRAVQEKGRSLLAIGITAAEGSFQKGDVVGLLDPAGREFARGLINYNAAEIARIQGLPSDRIAEVLGQCPYQEVIHRDNLAVMTSV